MASFLFTAHQLLSSLEKSSRDDGSSFLRLSSGAPEWATDIVRAAHCGELPNDSRYELIQDALQALSDHCCDSAEEAREASHEISLDLLPIHSGDLLSWFSDLPMRLSDCGEAVDCGRVSELSVYELLSEGFRMGAEETLEALISEIEETRLSVFDPASDCRLLLSDSHGQYIPSIFCEGMTEETTEEFGISWEDALLCQSGPDEELYWEAWQSILDSAEWEEDGEMWRLHQNGDLWAIRADVEIPEEAL